MARLVAACILASVVLGQLLAAQDEAEPAPPRASHRGAPARPATPATPATTAWRWFDPDREPFAAWHTDSPLQERVLADASARVQEVVGVAPPAGIEIMITPAYGFVFVNMEIGAKDGSLGLTGNLGGAMRWLGFVPRKERGPTTIGGDWKGEPGSTSNLIRGLYSPKHVKRMIVLNQALEQDALQPTVEHELLHAVQDELYSYDAFENFEGVTVDEWLARHAVEEGFILHVLGRAGIESDSSGAKIDRTSWSIRAAGLQFGDGLALVERVSARRATPRELMTLLFEHPPASTREALHPELYEDYLDTELHVPLPENVHAQALGQAMVQALAAGPGPVTWVSRLGEFGLQCQLVALGLREDEAGRLAAHWRHDLAVNCGEWHDPSATGVVWCLNEASAAEELAGTLRELVTKRGAKFVDVDVSAGGQPANAHAALVGKGLPDVVIVRQGEAVAFVAADELAPVVEAFAGP